MVSNVKVVIGASYGDEGKGLMTDYFCRSIDSPCITVLHNGGSQRGHTVINAENKRHVFHHFSSGTFSGSATYFADSFIINPLTFAEEFLEISPDTDLYCNPLCKWSTPFDMILNQIIEESRGDKRHGSCGYGIWETIVRHDNSKTLSFPEFMIMSRKNQIKYLENIRDSYIPERLREIGIEKIPEEWEDIVNDDRIILHFINDCCFFHNHIKYADNSILKQYPSIIFEGGQGLLLSQSETNPHTTPSYTGAENPVRILKNIGKSDNIEVCYVTRTYLTRHGAGDFPQECEKSEINPDIIDKTNIPNDWQGSIKYGRIDIEELTERITADFAKFGELNPTISLAVTHLNETNGKIISTNGTVKPESIGIKKIYSSYSEKNPIA